MYFVFLTLSEMPRRKSSAIRWKIVASVNAGLTQTETAEWYHCTQGKVSRLMAKHRLTGSVEDRPRSGGPRKTTARQDRHLIRLVHQNWFMSARQLCDRWQSVLRQRVSRQAVNQRLVEAGYCYVDPVGAPF